MDRARRRAVDAYAPPPRRHLAPAPPPDRSPYDDAWALVAPLRDRLVTVALARGLSPEDAQDVAHSVMCRAVERGLDDPRRVEPVLVKAVAVRCRELREEQERQERHLVRTRADDRLADTVDEAVCDRAHAHWLLARLPDRERRVLALSVDGETVTGIAARTGLSYPTVDRLLSRARKELRRIGGGALVLGGVLWRQRRLAVPPAATAAVAVAGVTVLTLHTVEPVHTRARPAVVAARPVSRPAAAVPRAEAPRPRPAPVQRVRAPAAVPPVAVESLLPPRPRRERALAETDEAARVGDEDVASRVGKCLRNGLALQTGGRVWLVCGEALSVQSGHVPSGGLR
jgi:RNA polymerase sigma factor (sigma-70 family)